MIAERNFRLLVDLAANPVTGSVDKTISGALFVCQMAIEGTVVLDILSGNQVNFPAGNPGFDRLDRSLLGLLEQGINLLLFQ